MVDNKKSPIWPFLLLVMVLFVLSVLAPKEWDSLTTRTLSELQGRSGQKLSARTIEPQSDRTQSSVDDRAWSLPAVEPPLTGQDPMSTVAAFAKDFRNRPTIRERRAAQRRTDAQPSAPAAADDSANHEASRGSSSGPRATDVELGMPARAQLLSAADERPLAQQMEEPIGQRSVISPNIDDFTGFKTSGRKVKVEPQVTRQFKPPVSTDETAPPMIEPDPDWLSLPHLPTPRTIRYSARTANQLDGRAGANSVERRPSQATMESMAAWPYPKALSDRVAGMRDTEPLRRWAHSVLHAFADLHRAPSLSSIQAGQAVQRLRQLAQQGAQMGLQTEDYLLKPKLLRLSYALVRRVDIWEKVHQIAAEEDRGPPAASPTTGEIRQAISSLKVRLQPMKYGDLWAKYLRVPELVNVVDGPAPTDTVAVRDLSRRALLRYQFAWLSPSRRGVCEESEFRRFADGLKVWAAEPIDYSQLLAFVENYEANPSPYHARQLASVRQILFWSNAERVAQLGQRLDMHYRNANVRVAISDQLINRFLPQTTTSEEDVDDFILGARTIGRAATETTVKVKLTPSQDHWKFNLIAQGRVASETFSNRGPATFYNAGDSSFYAEKPVIVHREGVRTAAARASASASNDLTGVETSFDPVPLFGQLVQSIAISRYESQADTALWEAESRIADRAGEQLDIQVENQLVDAEETFDRHVYKPLRDLALNPVALEMRTTDQRAISRYRLAGFYQLAAHTPRPIAPGDSQMSIQIHETALNNIIEQLGWHGRRGNLRDFVKDTTEIFGHPDYQLPEDFPEDVIVRFGPNQAIRFSFEDGRVTLAMAFAELSQGRNTWRNFVVRVHYRPASEQEGVDLVRDKYVELIGKRLRFSDQIALRGIFSRVFNRERPITVISKQLAENPKLAGLRVSQTVIGEGWIGYALAEKDPVSRTERVTSHSRAQSVR